MALIVYNLFWTSATTVTVTYCLNILITKQSWPHPANGHKCGWIKEMCIAQNNVTLLTTHTTQQMKSKRVWLHPAMIGKNRSLLSSFNIYIMYIQLFIWYQTMASGKNRSNHLILWANLIIHGEVFINTCKCMCKCIC